jgi:hypothetical protein
MSATYENQFSLRVTAEITDTRYGGSPLRLSEEVRLDVLGFLEMAKILGRFHDLAEELKSKK